MTEGAIRIFNIDLEEGKEAPFERKYQLFYDWLLHSGPRSHGDDQDN
jgi:hypothetical protein